MFSPTCENLRKYSLIYEYFSYLFKSQHTLYINLRSTICIAGEVSLIILLCILKNYN